LQKLTKAIIAASVVLSPFRAVLAEEQEPKKETNYPRLNASLEQGFLGVLDHKIQFSKNNTLFDYKKDGGQDVLFPIGKYSLDLELDQTHSFVFLNQPLGLTSRAVMNDDMTQDNITFKKGTPVNLLYDFPFFRVSYLYDFNPDPFEELSVGASLQLRNATIEFQSANGEQLVSKRNVGPVPILKARYKKRINKNWWYAGEADGFYAPISYLNGSTNEVIGAILDANLRVGLDISEQYFPYLNLRYIGGGAVGTSSEKDFSGDGYSNNWLHFLVLSVGINTPIIK